MKIRILKGGSFRMWFKLCRHYGHQYWATSEQSCGQTLFRCNGCDKEKWGDKIVGGWFW